jgi:hypothetical protein
LAVSAAAIMPDAPALLSTTTDLPSCFDSCSASTRPMMSDVPPAGKPLMNLISFDGNVCAIAGAAAAININTSAVTQRFIVSSCH